MLLQLINILEYNFDPYSLNKTKCILRGEKYIIKNA